MKTLKQKIRTPYFVIIIVMPIIIFFFFSTALAFYSFRETEKELIDFAENVDNAFSPPSHNNNNNNNNNPNFDMEIFTNDDLRADYDIMRASLQVSRYYEYTDFFLLSENQVTLLPETREETFLTSEIMSEAIFHLDEVLENETITFVIDGAVYHALYKNMNIDNSKMVYISAGYFSGGLLFALRMILILVSLVFISLGLFLSNRIANSLSKPILSLSNNVKSFSKGDFVEIDSESDCLEIVELKDSINKMSKLLKDHDTTQKTFLLNASHELRTPLMSISGYAEGTINGVFTDNFETLKIILEESNRLSIIVEKLLTLSRIENDIFDENFEILDISDIIKDYISKVESLFLNTDIKLILNIKDTNLKCKISDTALAQAIINIISNAKRYAKTTVSVDVFKRDDRAVILIKDDGLGIEDKDLAYLFDRFYKGKGGNLGLGLSISKTAVELMEGTLKAYNDDGAAFEISLKLN